jgi:hypothetical protein
MGLALGEVFLRLLPLRSYQCKRYWRAVPIFQLLSENIRFDPRLGYALRPRLDVRYETEDFSTRVTTNSAGYRDDEESLDNPDLLILGDSFAFGWGVEDGETAEKRLEGLLPGLRILNMAVPGYGTLHHYLQLENFLATHSEAPREVVIFLYRNDIMDLVHPHYPVWPGLRKDGGKVLITHPREAKDLEEVARCQERYRWGAAWRKSYVCDLAAEAFFPQKDVLSELMLQHREKINPFPGTPVSPYEGFDYTLRKLRRLCDSHGIDLYALFVPSYDEVETGEEVSDSQFIADRAGALGIPFIDPIEKLTLEDYYSLDGHWTAGGHLKAAQVLEESLREAKGKKTAEVAEN